MEPRRSPMALRPPQAPLSSSSIMNGANMSSSSSPSNSSSSSRPRTLKRTISKCGIDAVCSASDLNAIAPKKLAPLQEPSFSRVAHQQQQQQHAQYELTMRQQQQLQFHQQQQQRQQQLQEEHTANGMYVDDGEPVLLPRYSAYDRPDDDEFHGFAHEYSPVAPFGWDGTPQGAKDRYYESILESTTAFVSPSPQHVMYAYTPNSGVPSTNSTVSFGSSSYSPFTPHGGTSSSNNRHFQSTPGSSTVATAHVPHQAMQDLEYLNAANLHAIMVNYLEEMFQYYDLAKSFTFAGVGEMVRSVPFAFRYIQGLVKNRLGISWHLVGSFVENILDFIGDEDIREANIKEFADFLRSIQDQLYENMPPGNIFLNLYEFFQNVLAKFKKFLIQRWIQLQRIQFPCEFGKKSETLFLCMECHREHL